MNIITLDIETIPSQQEGALEACRAKLAPPGNMSKAETIAAWWQDKAPAAADEAYRKTSLNGTDGEIICIGWAFGNEPAKTVSRSVGESERELLCEFFGQLDAATQSAPLWIGHNIIGFDLRYLYQRAVINNADPRCSMPHDTRYNGKEVYDTMLAWAGWGNRISLKNLCAALNVPVKSDGIDGSQVWDYVQAGKVGEVATYCAEDVEATREVYHRMTFGRERGRQ